MLIGHGLGVPAPNPGLLLRSLYTVEGALILPACLGLWRMRNWGRVLALIAAAIGALTAATTVLTKLGGNQAGDYEIGILQILVLLVYVFVFSWFRVRRALFAPPIPPRAERVPGTGS